MKIPIETQLKLNKMFTPRNYQLPIFDAFEKDGKKKMLIVLARRAGKDIVCFNLTLRAALKRIGTYYYFLPTAVQARKVMFDGFTSEGKRIIDFIPKELVKKINISEMKITLINDSIIQFVGSEKFDSIRGTNPIGCVVSEAAYSHPQLYPTIRPILLQNNGWIIFISTPFGENWFYTLHEIARNNPEEWFVYFKTVQDTEHISQEQIQKEIESGEISADMAEQEYYCSFSVGAIGAYYSKYLVNMELNNQIGFVDWEPNYPVHTAWDIGMRDSTVMLMFQVIGRQINIIDMYHNSDVGLEHYINVLQSKNYTWGKHFGPHDLAVREFVGGGLSRIEKARQLGIKFVLAPNISIIDGIEAVRTTLPRIHIDDKKCKPLIAALRNYRKEYDASKKVYKNHPLHDNNSNFCDALRYLCLSLPKTRDSSNPEELEKRFQDTVQGPQGRLPAFFRDDNG